MSEPYIAKLSDYWWKEFEAQMLLSEEQEHWMELSMPDARGLLALKARLEAAEAVCEVVKNLSPWFLSVGVKGTIANWQKVKEGK